MRKLALFICLVAGPLHDAARKGDLEEVKQLIVLGAAVNAKDEFDYTALHAAVMPQHSPTAGWSSEASSRVHGAVRSMVNE